MISKNNLFSTSSARKNLFTGSAFCMFIALLISPLSAQGNLPSDSICAYTWNSDVNDCPEVLDCIYPDSWQDSVIDVAANVTRIARDGFKLCLDNIEVKGPADIIYIMDLSCSMTPECEDYDMETAGDPYYKRDDALAAGFNYQINYSPQSKAGYIGFSGTVRSDHVLSPVTVNTGQAELNEMVNRLTEFIENDPKLGGTNYREPLEKAISWLGDPSITPHNNKAVIFISDGRPSNKKVEPTSDQVEFLKNNNIPVYGIFLGREGEMGEHLEKLSIETGGIHYLVPPANTDTLETVVENIVKSVIKEFQPKLLRITNTTTNDTAHGLNYEKLGDTAWAAELDRFIPLSQGINDIQVVSTFEVQDGVAADTILEFSFHIDVSGELNRECYFCWPRTKLEVLVNNIPADTLTWKNDSFSVKLSYFGFDTLDSATIIIRSTEKQDHEVITIHNGLYDGNILIFETKLPFSISTLPPQSNQIIEAKAEDAITLFWRHPVDSRDTASTSAIVSNRPDKIRIYDNAGDPSNGTPYANPPDTDTITTDTPTPLFAKVFSNLTKWLPDFETDTSLTRLFYWNVTDTNGASINSAIGYLSGNNSNTNTFIADSAYNTVHIVVSLDIGIGFPLSDTVRLFIGPGEAKQLVIENTNDINMTPDLNKPVPLDPVHIYNNMTEYPAFAILRDAKGNWIGPATNAAWKANNSTIAHVTPGPSDTGVISRGLLPSGSTGIHAGDNSLKDTTTVYIWDHARLEVLYNGVLIDTLTWYHKSYTVRLTYLGHDNLDSVDIHVNTKNRDMETITIKGFTVSENGYIFEKTVPFEVLAESVPAVQGNDTTEAKLEDTVSLFWKHPYAQNPPDSASASVLVMNNPLSMGLYKEAGDPAALTPYPKPPVTDTITTDGRTPLFAKAFTSGNRWLPFFETDQSAKKLFTWSVTDTNGSPIDPDIGRLTGDSTNENYFEADMAYKTVVITSFLDVGIGYPVSCAVRFYIKPGIPTQIVIEATNDINKTKDIHNPAPWDPIDIWGTMSRQIAYAILRDTDGNWVSPALNAVWTTNDTAVASVTPGPSDSGVIIKGILPEGATGIHASQDGFKDTSRVITHHYSFEGLRISRVHLNDTSDIQNLTMDIFSDTMLIVQGKRTDNGNWIPVEANWSIDSSVTDPNPPAVSSSWKFTAITPRRGIITASLILTNSTLADTVSYNFTIPSPTHATFTILTPESLRIAGEVIKAEVSIYHGNNLIPGIWKYPKGNSIGGNDSAVYLDTLGNGGLSHIPFVKTYNNGIPEDSSTLNDQAKVVQTFNNGKDTLEFVLYYAPWQGYKHQLVLHLDNITAATDPFILHPGPIDTIHLIDNKNIHFPDTLSLNAYDSTFLIKAMGYDLYDNYLKNEPYTWKNDTSLVDYSISVNLDWILFEPHLAKDNQEGHVTIHSNTNPAVFNSIFIIIMGPKPAILSAVTRDFSGNGLLDAIELKLDKPLTLPPDFDIAHNIVVKNSNPYTLISASAFVPHAANGPTSYLIKLNENNTNSPQTSWKPLLSIFNLDSISPTVDLECRDGAAPVIWSVVKEIVDLYDRTKDIVTVTLSEPFFNANGSDFLTSGPVPQNVLYVWEIINYDTTRVNTILPGINYFNSQSNDWTSFITSNGKDLNNNHFVNLDSINGYVADKPGNIPNANNRKVRVLVKGTMGKIAVGPNPIHPTLEIHNTLRNKPLEIINPDIAIKWVKTHGGVLITLDIFLTVDKDGKPIGTPNDPDGPNYASGMLFVYDGIGNVTFKNESKGNLVPLEWFSQNFNVKENNSGIGPLQRLTFYWDGITQTHMKAAPGLYKLIIYIKMNGKIIPFHRTVAVGR